MVYTFRELIPQIRGRPRPAGVAMIPSSDCIFYLELKPPHRPVVRLPPHLIDMQALVALYFVIITVSLLLLSLNMDPLRKRKHLCYVRNTNNQPQIEPN